MWTRKDLKERAKAALQRNYWKLVMVSTLLLFLGCEAGGYNFSTTVLKNSNSESNAEQEAVAAESGISADAGQELSEGDKVLIMAVGRSAAEVAAEVGTDEDGIAIRVNGDDVIVSIVAIIVFLIVFFFVLAVCIVVDIFLINPFEVGGRRFMRKSIEDVAQVKEIAYAFDNSYKNVVKVMFYRDLYTMLWLFVFVIPGIIKIYQYLMVPYILSETPDMEYHEALKKSRDMMKGHKWRAFVLGLSFILWDFLGLLTLGMVTIFYVNPYRNLTFAALYHELKKTSVMITAS